MRAYVVGGAVRDTLLGLPVRDRDWVVVGATPEEMVAAGFRPVGKDFPVFLHPQSNEEYALARTERKTAPGYKGFAFHASPEVTLEEDLLRRDLTINAMARDEAGEITDPFGGRADLAARVLRHVSPAFAEDPLRILRVARFAARFHEFHVAPETLALMRDIVAAGEVQHLVAERVWQEVARGLMEDHPQRMFEVLRASGALARLAPELDALPGEARCAQEAGLARAVMRGAPLEQRWACVVHCLDTQTARELSERLKAPNEARDLAVMLAREFDSLRLEATADAGTRLDLLIRCDALRRPERFASLLDTTQDCAAGFDAAPWRAALQAAADVDAGVIAAACADKRDIPQQVRKARVAAIAGV
ncbi:MAG: multifunctional CCA tRNA nucleotidyl transferase/2'3'-cyclic phosphodiesterase/2'nucleotidase/phosphatase [Zoogloeaceae bacterium]|nr:multifunctional CCA tRNA nucleotidyl transferase/2'3'-cyclic phosphodiesterase/2'nucleotidase/phosphatase [Zoogloeaceae bacterium]